MLDAYLQGKKELFKGAVESRKILRTQKRKKRNNLMSGGERYLKFRDIHIDIRTWLSTLPPILAPLPMHDIKTWQRPTRASTLIRGVFKSYALEKLAIETLDVIWWKSWRSAAPRLTSACLACGRSRKNRSETFRIGAMVLFGRTIVIPEYNGALWVLCWWQRSMAELLQLQLC